MNQVLHVVGARPNFMKVAPIMRAMSERPDRFQQTLVHTGQHYDKSMSQVFFDDLGLPLPDVNLEVGGGSHAAQTAQVMMRIEPVLLEQKPDWVIVVGDVNSTVAAALVSSKLGIRVAHVEAGLRSFDRTMPEEMNRIVTDHLSDILFTTEESGSSNLRREGIVDEKVHFVGNVMIDSLIRLLPKAKERPILRELGLAGDGKPPLRYVLATLHRPGNVDDPGKLAEILAALSDIGREAPVIMPVHPRTRQRMSEGGTALSPARVRLLDPLGYLDFLALTADASLVITDSGGVQEETTYLGVPCLTARPNTERPITITHGTNRLVSSTREALVGAALDALGKATDGSRKASPPALWDGAAARRIADVLAAQPGSSA